MAYCRVCDRRLRRGSEHRSGLCSECEERIEARVEARFRLRSENRDARRRGR